MIYIIPKNGKHFNDLRCAVQPNRFELLPNCNQVVKFILNAENPSNTVDELRVEGCSAHYPIREIICEFKIKSTAIKPIIYISKKELTFDCFYGSSNNGYGESTDKTKSIKFMNFFRAERFKVINKSNLPLPVTLKIVGEFYFISPELKIFEQKIKFELKQNESQEIFVSFNNELCKDGNKFGKYYGKIKAYSLRKLQSIIHLQANIIYPTLEVSDSELKIVNNLLPRIFYFRLKNSGQMNSTFKLKFKEDSGLISKIQERKQENIFNISQRLMKQKCNLRERFLAQTQDIGLAQKLSSDEDDSNKVSLNKTKNKFLDELHTLIDVNCNEKDKILKRKSKLKKDPNSVIEALHTKDIRKQSIFEVNLVRPSVEITTHDVQKYFKIMTRALSETILSSSSGQDSCMAVTQTPSMESHLNLNEECSIRKYLMLSQQTGILRPNESRHISIYFCGSSDGNYII